MKSMKKVLFIVLILVSMPICAYAVSLNTLQNNTSQYIKICEVQDATVYFEPSSIKLIRSSHPYYTLQAKVYTVLYGNSVILKNSYTFNYDYNRSLFALSLSYRNKNANCTTDELNDYALTEIKKDSGISHSSKTDCAYDLQGNYLYKGNLQPHSAKAEFNTVVYAIADKIYYYHTECKEHFFTPIY